MDSKSSRNEEIKVVANFRDRAVPVNIGPAEDAKPATRSANQIIHPFAAFHDPAQTFAGKKPEAAKNANGNPLWLQVLRNLTLDEAHLQKIANELGMAPETVRPVWSRLVQELEVEIVKQSPPGA